METPPPLGQVMTPRTAGLAIASLVLGILSVTCCSILTGIPALILGIVALNQVGNSAGRLTGKGLSIAGIVMGGISFAFLPIMLALTVPAFSSARSSAMQAACMSNVRQCTAACINYVQEHDGKLPQTWNDTKEFLGRAGSMQQVLHCHMEPGTAASYELVQPGKRLADLGNPGETVIVREIKANHRGKRVVGFADGHVEMQTGK